MPMKRQLSFASVERSQHKRPTRRETFLAEMDRIIPWSQFVSVVEPHYFAGDRGRPPVGIEPMLRMYFVQCWFNLSDESTEEAIYDSLAVRDFVGIDLSRRNAPDATTLLQFRHLLEAHRLTERLMAELNALLSARGLLMRAGTIADATLIAAPPSTKNQERARDPEMHQTQKGKQWYFGAKAHIGVDIESGLVHSHVTTAAHAADVTHVEEVLHGEETVLSADAGYTLGAEREARLHAKGIETIHIAQRRSARNSWPPSEELRTLLANIEHLKARMRARVEHVFGIVKNRFGFRKTRYRGIAKTHARLTTMFMLANLVIAKKALLQFDTRNPT